MARPRFTVSGLMAAVAALAIILAVTGGTRRKRIVETLRSPIAVAGWSPSGLHLADGRIVRLPGIPAIPASSTALAESTGQGVDLGSDGRVYGLIRIHHGCGCDPIGEHIARVDLARLLEYLGDVPPVSPAIPGFSLPTNPYDRFSPVGWEVGEYQGQKGRTKGGHRASPKPPPGGVRNKKSRPKGRGEG